MYGDKIAIDLYVRHIEAIIALLADKVSQLENINELLSERNDNMCNDRAHDMSTIAVLSEENEKLRVMLAAANSLACGANEATANE